MPRLLLCLLFPFILTSTLLGAEANEPRRTNVECLRLKPRTFTKKATYVGHIIPMERAEMSSQVAGTIGWVGVVQGQEFQKGEVLVRFDNTKFKLNYELQESNYKLAKEDFEREQKLFSANLSSQAKLDAASNRMKQAMYQYTLAKEDYENSMLRGPWPGVVAKKMVETGEYKGIGKPLLEVMRIDQVKVLLNIPEGHIRFASVGKPVMVELDSFPGQRYPATILAVGQEANQFNRSFSIEIAVPNPDKKLLPGMLARVEMVTADDKNQIIIPRTAVMEDEKSSYVFVVDQGVAKRVNIVQGGNLKGLVQIVKGLRLEDQLIVVGQQLITHNEPIRITKIQDQEP